MKIEIGESLVRSWLRHVEYCEFAELNWKPSPTWQALPNEAVCALFESAKQNNPNAIGQNTLYQFLKQAEIDVLGLSTTTAKFHLVDIAFHSSGLNYGGQGKTGERIYKKLVRSALIAKTYFPDREAIIYFVTPKSSPAIKQDVESACELARTLFLDFSDISFQIIIGEDFKTQIVDEVLALEGEVADTSELFLRSWQLIAPFIKLAKTTEGKVTEPEVNEASVVNESRVAVRGIDRAPMHMAALYMSRFGHSGLKHGNQTQTFAYFGRKYEVAANTVKNIRDRFDFYVDNHRQGWNAPLPDNLRLILNEFGSMPEIELREVIGEF